MTSQTDGDRAARKLVPESLQAAIVRAEEQKAKADAIIAAIGDGISIQDTDFKVVYQNKIHRDIVGDHGGEYCYEAYRRNDRVCEGCPVEMTFKDGMIHRLETTNITPGGIIPIEVTASPLRDSAGKIIASIEIVRDISKRKRVEVALRESEYAYRTLSEDIPGIVYRVFLRENKRMQFFNNMLQPMTGYTEEELRSGKVSSIEPLILAEDWTAVTKGVKRALRKKEPFEVEYRLKHKNGDIRHFIERGRPRFDPDGTAIFVDGVIFDVTERRQALARQKQLLQELESVNKELNDFAHIVSHDLKAPLRAIGSLASWITTDYADKFDQQGKEQMDLLLNRVNRMHKLIEGILQYSRVGKSGEEKDEVDLNELVEQVVDFLSLPKHITVIIENKLPTIWRERTRIGQVFQNLLSNSAKFLDKPEGQIRIGCVDDGDFYRFSISDNGPGIEAKHFDRIFQMFQTLAARDQLESTGVGLALVNKIVELYGGRVWVESEVGKGSTFFFTLRREDSP